METKMQTDQSIVKQYDIKSNDLEYHIELGQSKNNSLYIILCKKGISFFSYETEYTLEQLYLINKNFRIFEKIEDLINSLDSIIKNGKLSVKENDDKQIEIKIKVSSFSGNEEEISLILKSKKISKEQLTEQLFYQIKELEKRI